MPGADKAGEEKRVRRFIRKELIWWISPILILLVLIGVFLVVVEGLALAPMIYDMF